jgi:hypothetical protein
MSSASGRRSLELRIISMVYEMRPRPDQEVKLLRCLMGSQIYFLKISLTFLCDISAALPWRRYSLVGPLKLRSKLETVLWS